MLVKFTTKHASSSLVTLVTLNGFTVLVFLPSCCVNSLLVSLARALFFLARTTSKRLVRRLKKTWSPNGNKLNVAESTYDRFHSKKDTPPSGPLIPGNVVIIFCPFSFLIL